MSKEKIQRQPNQTAGDMEETRRPLESLNGREQRHIQKGIGKTRVGNKELGISKAVGDFTGNKVGAALFRGKKPSNGVRTTADVVITGACAMQTGFGTGEHRLVVLDFLTSSPVGHD